MRSRGKDFAGAPITSLVNSIFKTGSEQCPYTPLVKTGGGPPARAGKTRARENLTTNDLRRSDAVVTFLTTLPRVYIGVRPLRLVNKIDCPLFLRY